MPQRSREAYLWDIADSCRAILEFVQERRLSDYEQNRMLRRAVERKFAMVNACDGLCEVAVPRP